MQIGDILLKKIIGVTKCKFEEYDDQGFLKFYFEDGTSCNIISRYGSYTGGAIDEYPTDILVLSDQELFNEIGSEILIPIESAFIK